MGESESETEAPQIITPLCPYCREGLIDLAWNTTGPHEIGQTGVLAMLIVMFCPQCHVALDCQFMPAIPTPRHKAIVIPRERFRTP